MTSNRVRPVIDPLVHRGWMAAVRWCGAWGLAAAVQSASIAVRAETPATVEYSRDVRPLLERRCASCHGADKRKGGFRVDSAAAVLRGGEAHAPAVRPGDSDHSPLIQVLEGAIPDLRMPAKGEPLSAAEIALLRAWIEQGAHVPVDSGVDGDPVRSHWAFNPVRRPKVPVTALNRGEATVNPIDAFVAASLTEKHLTPSPEADRVTLIRRVYFVMLGLPPSPEEVAAYLMDRKPEAFERLVDRVLADARYGERWGRHWLDVIRFAESNGFETNRERLSAWRFRDYVIAAFNQDKPFDQFVREQIAGDALGADVATGFLVGGPVDIVGSPDPTLTLQQRADELDDMVSTTGTAFLGLTLGCARCHSHKFDPISHREYYAMTALFAGVRHGERALPRAEDQMATLRRLDREIAMLEANLMPFLERPVASSPGRRRPAVTFARNSDEFSPVSAKWVRFTVLATTGAEPCLDELEVWAGDENVGLASRGARATASGTLDGFSIHRIEHLNDGQVGNEHSWISNESGKGWVQIELAKPERVTRIVWGRDRQGVYRDRLPTVYRIEVASAPGQWSRVADSDEREPFAGGSPMVVAPSYRFDGIPETRAAEGRAWLARLESLRSERKTAATSEMVYAGTFVSPPPAFRLQRGDPMQRRELVEPGTLALFHPLTLATNSPERERRLELARWITDPSHPLTARVLVNRVWQHQFGTGLVSTPNDFGKNGARPSHPELLDWLAAELVSHGWSVKHLQRVILTSRTWRQSSAPRADGLAADAGARLLWRFPPRRVEAEAIRDTILAVSGNLNLTAGGPSFYLHEVDRENVYHYHPKDRFGPAETRRMVYAFKVRMEQDGIFGAFDCPDGSLVAPKRSASTTPLQALNLFNSQFMLDQAEVFAARLRCEGGKTPDAQVRRAWVLAYNREPDRKERNDAIAFVASQGLSAFCRAILNSSELVFIP